MSTFNDLPPDIYGLIAEILVSDKDLETCARLNAVSRVTYAGTLPVLWHTIKFGSSFPPFLQINPPWDGTATNKTYQWLTTLCTRALGAKFIRYIHSPPSCFVNLPKLTGLMSSLPNLRAVVLSEVTHRPGLEVLVTEASLDSFNNLHRDLVDVGGAISPRLEESPTGDSATALPTLTRASRGVKLNFHLEGVRGKEGDVVNILIGGIAALLFWVDQWLVQNEEDGDPYQTRRPSEIALTGVSSNLAKDFLEQYSVAFQANHYNASPIVRITCSGSITEVEAIGMLQDTFNCMRSILPRLGTMSIGYLIFDAPELNHWQGIIQCTRHHLWTDGLSPLRPDGSTLHLDIFRGEGEPGKLMTVRF